MSLNVLTRSNNTVDKPVKPVRESGIELLRILTICGVVVLHYNGTQAFSLVEPNSLNYYILLVLESLFICAVDLFVLISGYFLALNGKRKPCGFIGTYFNYRAPYLFNMLGCLENLRSNKPTFI